MKKLFLLLLALTFVGCTTTKVIRTGRLERSVRVTSLMGGMSELDLLSALIKKVKHLNCKEFQLTGIVEGDYAIGKCRDAIKMMPKNMPKKPARLMKK